MARMDAATRLRKRGITVWHVDGALARLTETQSKGDDASKAIIRELVTLGAQLAVQIRQRVQNRGDLGGQSFPGYSARPRKMSPTYARAARLAPQPWPWPKQINESENVITRDKNAKALQVIPTWTFPSRRDIQDQLGRPDGSYTVTGGMWAGLQARGSGKDSVILDFQGSSEGTGRTVKMRTYFVSGYDAFGRPMTRGGNVGVRLPARMRNNQKAGGIYDAHNVHVLKPTQEELNATGFEIVTAANTWLELRMRG